MDLVIKELVIEEDRPAHIAKHDVNISEVIEIVIGDYVFIEAKLGRWQLIGKTKNKRFLTIIVGERRKAGSYGLVTARPASREERSFYKEFIVQKGGEL